MYYNSKQNQNDENVIFVKSFPNENAIKEMARISKSTNEKIHEHSSKTKQMECVSEKVKECSVKDNPLFDSEQLFLVAMYLMLSSKEKSKSDLLPDFLVLLSFLL